MFENVLGCGYADRRWKLVERGKTRTVATTLRSILAKENGVFHYTKASKDI